MTTNADENTPLEPARWDPTGVPENAAAEREVAERAAAGEYNPPREPRDLTGHKVNGCNDGLAVWVMDPPGHGGASHEYRVCLGDAVIARLNFQNGPIAECGTNGITHEVLLAVLIDRLEGFQAGQYACEENARALRHLITAQNTLKTRTERRLARGVEGTHAV